MASDDDVYTQLWHRAEADGAFVTYWGMSLGESGTFYPREDQGRKPWIQLVRPRHLSEEKPSRLRNDGSALTDEELRAELMTLAHEYGHFQSWLRSKNAGGDARANWKACDDVAHRRDDIEKRVRAALPKGSTPHPYLASLRAANQADLTEVDRQRIVEEETTAWRIGREILEQLGYEHLDAYDRRADAGPKIYRYRLGMISLDEVPEWARG